MDDLLGELKVMLGETLAIDPGRIRADKPLIEYGLDSVRMVDLLVSVEEKYGVAIPDGEAARMRTLADAEAYLRKKLAR